MTREKLIAGQVCVRIDERMQAAIDEYVERRSRAARVTLSRAHAVRELLESLMVDDGRLFARECACEVAD